MLLTFRRTIYVVWIQFTAGEDFAMITDSLLTLSAEYTNDTITIPIFNDNVFEPTESFIVNLSFVSGLVHRVK